MNRIEQPYYKPRTVPQLKIDLDNKPVKKLWIRKSYLFCHVAYTSMKAVATNAWSFNSGCSRHMTGESKYLSDYHTVSEGHVSFGDEEKRCVLEKETLHANGLPKLKNVRHLEGIKANLMSISQLCDQKLNVKFT